MTSERAITLGRIWPIAELDRSNQVELYDSRDVMAKPTLKLYIRVNSSVDIDRAVAILADKDISAERGITEESIYVRQIRQTEDLNKFETGDSGIPIDPRAGELALMGHNIMRHHITKHSLPDWLTSSVPIFVQVDTEIAKSRRCYECYRRESEYNTELKVGPHKHVVALGDRTQQYNKDTFDPSRAPLFYNTRPRYKFPAIPKKRVFEIQTYPSIIASKLLAPEPGQTIIDACAGPGRKSIHIAELMEQRGKLYAFEIDYRRKSLIRERAQRFGININDFMFAVALDSTKEVKVRRILNGSKVDSVLIDPPCSSLGTRPKIYEPAIMDKWQYFRAIDTQRNVLGTMSRFVKKGGRLVYSTCTLNREENEIQIERFLKVREGEFTLEKPKLTGVDLEPYLCRTGGPCEKMALKFLPKSHDSPGYFIAVIKKE